MALPFIFAGDTTAYGAYLDANFAVVGAMGITPCTAVGTNTITLTPAPGTPTVGSYANYQVFGFIAAASTTGSVTVAVGGLGAFPVYQTGSATAQAGSGALTIGVYYQIAYNSALNGALGGFQIVNGAINGSPYFSVKQWGAVGNGTTNDTAALTAAVASGLNIFFPAGEYGFNPTTTTALTVSTAGQQLAGMGGDASRIVKWGNGVLVDLEGDSCGLSGLSFIGQFQRALMISNGWLNAAAPTVVDTTTNLTIGATSVGVTNSPVATSLNAIRSRGAGLDGINWMEGTSPIWTEVSATYAARWGFNGTGAAIDRSGMVGLNISTAFCGNGAQAGGGGFNIACQNACVTFSKAFGNFGPGYAIGTDGTNTSEFNRWKIYDELNGTSNSAVNAWVMSTAYTTNTVVSNTWTIATTTSGSVNAGTLAVPVVSGLHVPNGTAIVIAGAGPGGANFRTLVLSGGGTNTITLEFPTSTTVNNAAVSGSAAGLFVATNSATSGATPPTVATGTVSDGTVTWQARDGNAVEMLIGRQNEFDAVFLSGPAVVSTSYSAGSFNNLFGTAQPNVWFNAEVLRATQRISISQFMRYADPVYVAAQATTNQSLDLEAPIPGSPSVFRLRGPGTSSQTTASIVGGDATGQEDPVSNVPIALSGPTLAGARAGLFLSSISVGGRVNPLSGAALTGNYDFSSSGLSGGAVDASEADTYLFDTTGGNLTMNIRAGGTGAVPGRKIEIIKTDTGANHVTVSGTGNYITAAGSNTQSALSGITITASACSCIFELVSLTLGSGSTPLWIRRQ